MKGFIKSVLLVFVIVLSVQADNYDRLVEDDYTDGRTSLFTLTIGDTKKAKKHHYRNKKLRYFYRGGVLLCESRIDRKLIDQERWRFIESKKIFVRGDNFFYLSECKL